MSDMARETERVREKLGLGGGREAGPQGGGGTWVLESPEIGRLAGALVKNKGEELEPLARASGDEREGYGVVCKYMRPRPQWHTRRARISMNKNRDTIVLGKVLDLAEIC